MGWGFLLPLGAIFARFFKHRPNGLWFSIHRPLQMVGLLVATVGWIIAITNFKVFGAPGFTSYTHGVMGMLTMSLGFLQPINAFLRPHPPSDGEAKTTGRQVWEILHKSVGWITLALAVCTIGLGTTLLPLIKEQRKFQWIYGLGIGSILVGVLLSLKYDKDVYVDESTKKEAKLTDKKMELVDNA